MCLRLGLGITAEAKVADVGRCQVGEPLFVGGQDLQSEAARGLGKGPLNPLRRQTRLLAKGHQVGSQRGLHLHLLGDFLLNQRGHVFRKARGAGEKVGNLITADPSLLKHRLAACYRLQQRGHHHRCQHQQRCRQGNLRAERHASGISGGRRLGKVPSSRQT